MLDDSWRVRQGHPYTTVVPLSGTEKTPLQGWKIHLSSVPESAAVLLERVVPLLRDQKAVFKFATDRDVVRWLASRECGRAESGKVIAVYPASERCAVSLAINLHAATEDLQGPRILTDREFRPGSIVHYRFGGFTDFSRYDSDGVRRFLLRRPDGSLQPDNRESWYDPPPWAPCPFVTQERPAEEATDGGAPTLAGRYVVDFALRHSTKGGVYAARDTRTGQAVVLKHARAFTESMPDGGDARTALRREEANLQQMRSAGIPVPATSGTFTADSDLFLVEERLPGIHLGEWIARLSEGGGVPGSRALPMARRLVALVASVHAEGYVFRDLAPTNILVGLDDTLSLVDLEEARLVGTHGVPRGTRGYLAPELRSNVGGRQATVAEDLYSLGGLLFLLATGTDPVLPDDDSPMALLPRLRARLSLSTRHREPSAAIAAAALGLLRDAPAERHNLKKAETVLAEGTAAVLPRPTASDSPELWDLPDQRRLLTDGLAYLEAGMAPDEDRLWSSSPFGSRTDPCTVQHGAAGILMTLLHAGRLTSARTAAEWLRTHASRPGSPCPGLYFGRGGTAWVLAEAGHALGDERFSEKAVELARALPTTWPNPDVAHGLAGAVLTHLHCQWRSGDTDLLERAAACTDGLRRAAAPGPTGPLWPIPDDGASRFSGTSHYGFAHGAAGVGYALLASGLLLGRADAMDLAVETGRMLCRLAQIDDEGGVLWTAGPGSAERLPHWCSGASGIGSFLVRLHACTGEQLFGDYARAAARTVSNSRWRASSAACHGLSGSGQYLLDAAELLADETYREWGAGFVPLLATRHCYRGGRLLIPDETNTRIVPDYQTGAAGVLDYLLRLGDRSSRPFYLDDLMASEYARGHNRTAAHGRREVKRD
ncbi:class IV lanthionine synthetase LanL [Streptomyces vastus]